jgi:ankyrin repeat protein
LLLASAVSFAGPARLADAVERNDVAAAKGLLGEGVPVADAQPDGMTALHWAAEHDNLELARLLVAAGASARVENQYGVTPLTLACQNGNAAMIALLLGAGADPNVPLRSGETPLMTAARHGRVEPVQTLLASGAKIDAREKQGQTALMWAAAEGHGPVVELLMAAGADYRARLESGFTPLLFAVREGRMAVAQALLRAGVDVNEPTPARKTSGKGLKPGTTALSLAVENGHFELAAALLEAGANPNDQRSGYTALHMLTWVRKPDHGDDGDPSPVGSGNIDSLQLARKLVAAGADVNARLAKGPSGGGRLGRKGATPFLMAADTADVPLMRLLLELGADPAIPNAENCPPLLAAAGVGTRAPEEEAGTEAEALAAVRLILERGADLNAVDNNGETAMHGAAYASFPRVVQLLAERGAKIETWNKKNAQGWTPLLIAEGHRFGNFKPSFETLDAIKAVMVANGITPPPPTPPVPVMKY